MAHRDQRYRFDPVTLRSMRDIMLHRGPDDAGDYMAGGIALGSRRLSILDLSERGHMPMNTADGRYWITYNGEIYNFREHRAWLESKGYVFRSNSDTEVLLYLYQELGSTMLSQLNGIFALAIWDTHERALFLARDHLGVKPLYYALQDDAFYFASEAKAFLAAGVIAEFDQTTWEELLLFRYVAGENTVFTGICRLLPGHWLLWQNGTFQTYRWWRLDEQTHAKRHNLPADPYQWYRQTFDDAIDRQRISDVPIGVLLSGGLDSSSVAASLATLAGSGIASFTVGFNEPDYDEAPLAQQVAQRWGLEYNSLILSPDEVVRRLFRTAWLNDEPLVHQNDIHIWAISEFAKPRVTVLLSGEGGDETLGGYIRYQPLRYPAVLNAARPIFPSLASALHLTGRLEKLGHFLEMDSLDWFVLLNACTVLPKNLQQLGLQPKLNFPYRQQMLAEARKLYPMEPIRQAMYLDHHTFLPTLLDRNDRMTMGASIECRVPFLDYRLVEGLAALPTKILFGGRQTKSVLRRAIGSRLPTEILHHRKWGFSIPWESYLRETPELRQIVHELPDREPIRSGPMDRTVLQRMVKEFLTIPGQHGLFIRNLLMIAVWYQVYFDSNSYSLA